MGTFFKGIVNSLSALALIKSDDEKAKSSVGKVLFPFDNSENRVVVMFLDSMKLMFCVLSLINLLIGS